MNDPAPVVVIGDSGPRWPRVIALFLAMGGSFWGVLLLVAFGPSVLVSTPFGPGYLVTVGYFIRVVSTPTLLTCRVLWVASILVQGWWLVTVGLPDLPRTGPNVFFLWWASATVSSVIALVAENDRRSPHSA